MRMRKNFPFDKPLENFTKKELASLVKLVKGPIKGRITGNNYNDVSEKVYEHTNEVMSNTNWRPQETKNIAYVMNFIDHMITYRLTANTTIVVNALYQQLHNKGN